MNEQMSRGLVQLDLGMLCSSSECEVFCSRCLWNRQESFFSNGMDRHILHVRNQFGCPFLRWASAGPPRQLVCGFLGKLAQMPGVVMKLHGSTDYAHYEAICEDSSPGNRF